MDADSDAAAAGERACSASDASTALAPATAPTATAPAATAPAATAPAATAPAATAPAAAASGTAASATAVPRRGGEDTVADTVATSSAAVMTARARVMTCLG